MVENNKQQDQESLPAEAIVMQMVIGAWISQAISAITRLDIPDLLKEHGPRTALELTDALAVRAKPELLTMGDTSGTQAKLLDVDMLVFDMGKERTEKQWRELYEAAGLTITSMTPLRDNFGTSIVEGRRADAQSDSLPGFRS